MFLILGLILLYYSLINSGSLDFILSLLKIVIESVLNIIINEMYCNIFRIIGVGFLFITSNLGKIIICLLIIVINTGDLYLIAHVLAILAIFNSYLLMLPEKDKI